MDTQNQKSGIPQVDLSELMKQLMAGRRLIMKLTLLSAVIGVIIAFSIPREYTCSVKLAPEESKPGISGNISDLAAIAGLNIGISNEEGVNQTLFPDIVHSTPFVAGLLKMNVSEKDGGSPITLYHYLDKRIKSPWWSHIIAFPFRIMNLIRYGRSTDNASALNPYNLSYKQEEVFNSLKERITVNPDKKNGIITAGVTMQDPAVAAMVSDSLVTKLEQYMIRYRTSKANQDLEFALKVFEESRNEYYTAQKNLAGFVDRNKNIVQESVLIERKRLENEQALAYSVYSNLAQQVEMAKLKVQEKTPSFTIIEPARIPVKKSNASRLLIILAVCFFGALAGAVKVIWSGWGKIQTYEQTIL